MIASKCIEKQLSRQKHNIDFNGPNNGTNIFYLSIMYFTRWKINIKRNKKQKQKY